SPSLPFRPLSFPPFSTPSLCLPGRNRRGPLRRAARACPGRGREAAWKAAWDLRLNLSLRCGFHRRVNPVLVDLDLTFILHLLLKLPHVSGVVGVALLVEQSLLD